MSLSVTGLYAAMIGLLTIFLGYRVVRLRRHHRVGIGSGGQESLERAVRAHANLVEYAPLALLLILILEISGLGAGVLHGLGAMLLLGRLLHAWGLSGNSGTSFGRFYGTALTWLVIVISALLLLSLLFIR